MFIVRKMNDDVKSIHACMQASQSANSHAPEHSCRNALSRMRTVVLETLTACLFGIISYKGSSSNLSISLDSRQEKALGSSFVNTFRHHFRSQSLLGTNSGTDKVDRIGARK